METTLGLQHEVTLLCARGGGVAVCVPLRRLVTSSSHDSTLSIFEIQPDNTFVLLTIIGSKGRGPLQFASFACSGRMCFTVGSNRPTLLVTEADNDRVQEVDVMTPAHVGFPIRMPGPCGVAASASLFAVSAWKKKALVHVFDAGTRALLFALDCRFLVRPFGLRISADGTTIVVADWDNGRVSMFRTSDGGFAGCLPQPLPNPKDVEECEGGWLVTCADTVAFVGKNKVAVVGGPGSGVGQFSAPCSLALAPGLGFVVREWGNKGRLQVFSTPEVRRMHELSATALAWMGCVARVANAFILVSETRR